jgi:DNA-binding SARP family transcriptional activator/Flp pilus assembly protein TadD
MTAEAEFCLLGPLLVRCNGVEVPIPPGKQRVLLTTLLLNVNQAVSMEELTEALWGSKPPASARASVHSYVKRLRKALAGTGDARIRTLPDGYLIRVDASELDLSRFAAMQAAARQAARQGNWHTAAAELRAAVSLWRGAPLADVPSELLAVREVARLAEMRLQAMEERIDAELHLGRHADVIAELRQLAGAHPLREHLHALLMVALYRDGRQSEALAAYRQARHVLIEELGIEPTSQLRDLEQQILTGDPALVAPPLVAQQGVPDPPPSMPPRTDVVPRQLPASVRYFAGRSSELAALTELLDRKGARTPGTVVISAIGGTAGVGKTALAIHFARQVAESFPDGQLYVNLRGFDPTLAPKLPAEAVRLALDAFAVPAEQIPANLDAQVGMYRSLLAGKKVLIVLDNAADAGQVRPLLPGSPTCLVIVTSRNRLAGLVAIDGAIPLSLDLLAHAEAHDLLTGILGAARVAAEPDATDQLIAACGHLPLALTITGARAATNPQLPLAALATELADATHRLDALRTTDDPLASVRASLACSYQHLSADVARTFRLLGVHPGPVISLPATASLTGIPRPQTRRHLSELADANLVTQDSGDRYTLHDLVRLYAAEQAQRIDSDTERQAAIRRMLDHYLHTGHIAARLLRPTRDPITLDTHSRGTVPEDPADQREATSWFRAEHQVLMAAVDYAFAAGQDTHAWNIAWTLQDYFQIRGHWREQLAVSTTALAAACRLGDLTLQAKSHHYLARGATELGRHDDACSHYRHALDLFQRLSDRNWQAHVHLGLAGSLNRQGQPGSAVDHARQALELYIATNHQVGRAAALSGIGWYLCHTGDCQQALLYCQQALVVCRKVGARHSEGDTLDNLGYAHRQLGHYTEATACYQQAVAIYRQLGFRPRQAVALSHLGDTYHSVGDLEAACTAWREALAILDDLGHPDAEQVRATLQAAEVGSLAATAL